MPPKDVSLVKAEGSPADVCSVFEGFMDFLSAATFGLEKGECLVLNSVATVSYTHLDVYKRQGMGSYGRNVNQTAGRAGSMAVSVAGAAAGNVVGRAGKLLK